MMIHKSENRNEWETKTYNTMSSMQLFGMLLKFSLSYDKLHIFKSFDIHTEFISADRTAYVSMYMYFIITLYNAPYPVLLFLLK